MTEKGEHDIELGGNTAYGIIEAKESRGVLTRLVNLHWSKKPPCSPLHLFYKNIW